MTNIKENHTDLKSKIIASLKKAGFSEIGFSKAKNVDNPVIDTLKEWINSGRNANMKWLEKNIEKRANPALLHKDTKTIISMLHLWPETNFDKGDIRIAAYAHGHDYHEYLRNIAAETLQILSKENSSHKPRFFTDSAPIFDRFWAWKAGLGFIGKNGFLINPKYGSRVFISHIFTAIEFEEDNNQIENLCGNCRICLESCPTNAFNNDGHIDAKKCISYYNIEASEPTPESISKKNPGWIFGCDSCQEHCPYNQAEIDPNLSLHIKSNWATPNNAEEWLKLSNDDFIKQFSHTPLNRAGLEKIKQNILNLGFGK